VVISAWDGICEASITGYKTYKTRFGQQDKTRQGLDQAFQQFGTSPGVLKMLSQTISVWHGICEAGITGYKTYKTRFGQQDKTRQGLDQAFQQFGTSPGVLKMLSQTISV
jgi:hypothetical protein